MLYELRTYHAMPGRLPDLNRRFAEITMDFFKKHGIQVVGFWTNELGGSSDQLIYMLAYDSLADREKKWSGFFADKDRLAKFVAGGWDSSATAEAVAGQEGVAFRSSFIDGVALYQITDKGLMAQADVSGTKFWVNDELR